MKKIIAFITLIVFAACLLCSCTQTTSDGTSSSYTSSVSKKEQREKKREFNNFIRSLDVDKIEWVAIKGGEVFTIRNTSDKEIISRWIKLLKNMELTVRPRVNYAGWGGLCYGLYFYIDGEEKRACCMGQSGLVWTPEFGDVELDFWIENYREEIKSEEQALLKEMRWPTISSGNYS